MSLLKFIHHIVYTCLPVLALWGLPVASTAQGPVQYRYQSELAALEGSIIFTSKGEGWAVYSLGSYLSRFNGVTWTHYDLRSLNLPTGLNYLGENERGVWFISDMLNPVLVCYTEEGAWEQYPAPGKSVSMDHTNGNIISADSSFYLHTLSPRSKQFVRAAHPAWIRKDTAESFSQYYTKSGACVEYIKTEMDGSGTYKIRYGEGFRQVFEVDNITFTPSYLNTDDMRGIFPKGEQFFWLAKGKYHPISIHLPDGQRGRIVELAFISRRRDDKRTGFHETGLIVESPDTRVRYLYAMSPEGRSQLLLTHLARDHYSFFSQDTKGQWWYGSSTGIIRTDHTKLAFDQSNPDMVSGLHAIAEDAQGRIWLGGYNDGGWFSVFERDRLSRRQFEAHSLSILPGTYRNKQGVLYFFAEGDHGLYALKDGQFRGVNLQGIAGIPLMGYYFKPLSNGKVGMGLVMRGLGIAEERNGTFTGIKTIQAAQGMQLTKVHTIAEDARGRLWLGHANQGIAIYDTHRDTAVTWLSAAEYPFRLSAISSHIDDKGALWLGAENGLFQLPNAADFDYDRDNLFEAVQKVVLPGADSSLVSFLAATGDYLIVGTKTGIYFFDKKYHGDRPRIFTLLYGKDISGSGSEQNAVLLDSKGFLWAGTHEGALRIDLARLAFDTSLTSLYLDRFTAGDAEIRFSGSHIGKLPAKKRNITFSFLPSGNTFLKDDLYFDITVINSRGDTLFNRIQTKERTGEMPYLPQGDYTLHVTAYKHNIISGQAVWEFTIPRLPSENPWVLAGMALVVLGIPFTYLYLKKRHQVELEKSRRERDGLQIRVLASFLNPHFINNTLHWVQSRYRKDPDTATIIGRLSENVYHLYKNTQAGKAYHPLSKELEIVQNYLIIQQLRFGEGSFQVALDLPKESANPNVPAMLLQIHAENAIEQGIRNRKGANHFLLSVKMEQDGCHIVIEDNGCGRLLTNDPSASGRKGSTAVMADLISLFNRYNRRPLTVRYEDHIFSDTDGKRYGTRVHFFIPDNYNYELS